MNQLSFETMALPGLSRSKRMRNAREAADLGMGRAADGAERAAPGWAEKACERLRVFARHQVGLFTVEQARAVIEAEVSAPPDARAWGVVSVMALRRGFIAKTNRSAPAASSNGSGKPLYRAGAKA